MLRAIREIQPRWVVGENVFGITNWNGGLVFDEVQADLEAKGYEVQAYVLPACAVNAPHRRDRVWFVAHRNIEQRKRSAGRFQPELVNGSSKATPNPASQPSKRLRPEQRELSNAQQGQLGGNGSEVGNGDVADADSSRFQKERSKQQSTGFTRGCLQRFSPHAHEPGRTEQHRAGEPGRTGHAAGHGGGDWHDFPTTQPTIRAGNDGLSSRLDGITFSKWRNESIKAAGNAVVPQVVYQIFKAIEIYEK